MNSRVFFFSFLASLFLHAPAVYFCAVKNGAEVKSHDSSGLEVFIKNVPASPLSALGSDPASKQVGTVPKGDDTAAAENAPMRNKELSGKSRQRDATRQSRKMIRASAPPAEKHAEKPEKKKADAPDAGSSQEQRGGSVIPGSPSGTRGDDGGAMMRAFGTSLGPSFKTMHAPVFPPSARRMGISGAVEIRLTLDETGKVLSSQILKSPHAVLSQAALEAVGRSSFYPYKINGRAQPCHTVISIHFKLEDR